MTASFVHYLTTLDNAKPLRTVATVNVAVHASRYNEILNGVFGIEAPGQVGG
jgi:hypothetical protein